MVDYSFLEQFVSFSRCGTLSEVAEQFHISQPTITRNMQRVEEMFGVPLFTRAKNRIALNENGKLAAGEAERVLQQTRDMLYRVRAFDKAQRTISIGSCVVIPIPQLNRELNNLFPKVTISIEVDSLDVLLQGLEDGTYQLVLLPYEPDRSDVISQKIEEEHLMFSLPDKHPFAGRDSLSMADMNGQNLLLLQEVGFWREIVD